jgi:hypothetical protein
MPLCRYTVCLYRGSHSGGQTASPSVFTILNAGRIQPRGALYPWNRNRPNVV